ncbi:hypothetical protein CYY_009226 [Polysphondylium violaceum]|uniref:Pesticidal crystal protein N-terminal domain-containing protein n=1 Tax=Polysphondylium violaceum TaxID=133409 RepID=A0A8J4PM20_9MYCE|nr:hypothetical protein CYY_009226 [Polysphondylium violaceum]
MENSLSLNMDKAKANLFRLTINGLSNRYGQQLGLSSLSQIPQPNSSAPYYSYPKNNYLFQWQILGDTFQSLLNLAFPTEDPYLRKLDFEKRLKKLISDMEKKMDKKIDEEVVKFCQAKFESLCSAGYGFAEIEQIYNKQKKEGKKVSDPVKTYIAANHVSFRNLLMECLIFFGREDKIELLIKLYLLTAVMYIAFLRDTHFCGIEWGLPEEYVKGVEDIKSMESKIHDTIRLTHEHYSKFFKKVNDPKKISEYLSLHSTDIMLGISKPLKMEGDYRPLTSQFTYADVTRYKLNQIWLQRTKEEGEVYPYGRYRLPISNRIYIADFHKMGCMSGAFGRCEYGHDSVNSVTGTKGLGSSQAIGLFYDAFYFTEPKNLTFRILGITDSNAELEMIIREIPEDEIGDNPNTSGSVATKTHKEKIPFKKLFESSSGPMSEFVSKPYKFEQIGSIYFEVKVNGGHTRNLYTLEIIDTQN